ncbi:pyocin activator PrtN family protein [Atopomonas sediminilitoris]|uniref:pyocin activator PrtN family protein n=1 Tax=Atopomonas sediminilitoris TaxID=2919919 RepID=UPI001F4EA112|nr:pyocin activator PrtN family protein [Atopomonas sediminilitoris]MCJ8170784.1 pyocin activator PrtN family protein [Atopomonas sediminilitoris]
MNTAFILLAQYNGIVIIPLERVCRDYFSHLTPEKLKLKIASGDIDLPLVAIEKSQKAARGVHLNDLATYLDAQHQKAKMEHEKLMGRGSGQSP